MPDDTPPSAEPTGFPFATAAAALAGLFLFAGLVLVAYYSPNYLSGPAEPKADPAAKLAEVRAKNQAVLDGADPGTKMPVGRATAEVLTFAEKAKDDKAKQGRLPFPVEPKAAVAPAPADGKDKK
ncbi:MAG: hypothetical protein K2X82_05265 [Gemmataceae bacterium]|nr:hypothetical protein [Gemmataceae bacterium]